MPNNPANDGQDTKLGQIINREIAHAGPMSIANYMALCLTHPQYGYYKNNDPLGARGDFITAPEISQMFGEFIGLFIANTWKALGAPKNFTLLELGPGRGTLLKDVMRVLRGVDGLLAGMELCLLEVSETLKKMQQENLSQYNPQFIENIAELKNNDAPLIIIANEFFDALPIRQFQKQNNNWHERAIGVKIDEKGREKRTIGLSPNIVPADILPKEIREAKEGAVWELNIGAIRLMGELAQKIVKQRGAILAIDYGYDKTQIGETFQALEKHQYVDPLARPGKADLTAHIDFEALAKSAKKEGAKIYKIKTQGEFLLEMGINERANALIKANPSYKEEIELATKRLIDKNEMGELFKVLCVASNDLELFPFSE